MAGETVTCAKGNNYKLHKEHALTDKKDVSVKAVPVESTKAIVFFIGGAGDKERYYFSGPPPVSAYLSPLLIDSTTHGGEGV